MPIHQMGMVALLVAGLAVTTPAFAQGAKKAASGEPLVGPKITIINNTPARVFYRVRLWQQEDTFVKAGSTMDVAVPDNLKALQSVVVEARSRSQWDKCSVNVYVGGKLVVDEGKERIICTPTR